MKAQRPGGSVCLKVAARILASRGVDTDSRRIFAQLRKLGMLEGTRATEKAVKKGLIIEAAGDFRRGEGGDDCYVRAFLTGAGIAECIRHLRSSWKPNGDVALGVDECKLGF